METRAQLRKCAGDIDTSQILNDDEPTHDTERGQGKCSNEKE